MFKVFTILISSMVIDLDHLMANPIFDPQRCSIGFHPMHSYIAIAAYILLFIPDRTRIFAAGLTIHILLDLIDCFFMKI